jgi:two-component system, NarL family, nitrate/nitrite sensor histidine kinase NarX
MSQRNLAAKLAWVSAPFLLVGFVAIASTLWISWQLDGGAAAVNEAGRMRMQAYRLALAIEGKDRIAAQTYASEFERSLTLLRNGDPQRPLFVPWDEVVTPGFTRIEAQWLDFRRIVDSNGEATYGALATAAGRFTQDLDAWVIAIEHHLSRWTAMMHLLQTAMLLLGLLGAAALVYTGYRFVLGPVGQLTRATTQIQNGDFSARVDVKGGDEFATLGTGFNTMAEHLQSVYRNLEAKVAEKTTQLEQKHARLEALYGVTTLVANTSLLEPLARGFVERFVTLTRADGVALRVADVDSTSFVLIASHGIPEVIANSENCMTAGACHCGQPAATSARVIPIRTSSDTSNFLCANAGFRTVVTLPVRQLDRVIGEVDLMFYSDYALSNAERSLFDAICTHLAAAIENIRLGATAREAAVAQEREFIARELHDSIAQSLAFLKMQVDVLRSALRSHDSMLTDQTVEDIAVGVRESYADVRELLMHFRTRTSDSDIESALRTTLRKFEHQTGIAPTLRLQGHGIELPSDTQLQVLHIVQEALSNIRKHSQATKVEVIVQRHPLWRFEVQDNGCGFDDETRASDETHVGLRIMRERAERIGATLQIDSEASGGTRVVLALGETSGAHAAQQTAAPAIPLPVARAA